MRRKLIIAFVILVLGSLSTLLLASIAPKEALGQAIFLIVGLGMYFSIQYPLPKLYEKLIPSVATLTVLLLLVTLILGRVSHGAQRWLPIGPFHIQVSEFAKPVLALFLAWIVVKFPLSSHQRVLIFASLSLLFFVPVFLQPDLGSSLVFVATIVTILFLQIKKLRMLLPWIGISLVIVLVSWQFLLYPYQRDRLTAFLSPSGNASYNAEQANITVGSGKLFGRGLGHGVQSQLRFLPEFHTDFFFASLAEELGALGVFFVLGMYGLLYWQLLSIRRFATPLAKVATLGFTAALFFQMTIHMGMNMKLFPITGIPLPFLSSGGSSFLATCIGLGVLVRLGDKRSLEEIE